MMAPKYEMMRVLHQAIEQAGHALELPIEKIEVSGGKITVWSASERACLTFQYHNAYDPRGGAMPGSGSWQVTVEKVERGVFRGAPSAWRNLFTAWRRSAPPN